MKPGPARKLARKATASQTRITIESAARSL